MTNALLKITQIPAQTPRRLLRLFTQKPQVRHIISVYSLIEPVSGA